MRVVQQSVGLAGVCDNGDDRMHNTLCSLQCSNWHTYAHCMQQPVQHNTCHIVSGHL